MSLALKKVSPLQRMAKVLLLNFTTLFPIICHSPKQNMGVFYTFVNYSVHVCSNFRSLNSEIPYLKVINVDRGYKRSITDTAVLKLRLPLPHVHLDLLLFPILALIYITFPPFH